MRKRLLSTFAALSATVVLAVQASAATVFLDENSIDAVTSPGGTRVDVTLAVDCFPFAGEVNPRISSVSLGLDQALSEGQIVGGLRPFSLMSPATVPDTSSTLRFSRALDSVPGSAAPTRIPPTR